jgi:hypothetical protein
VPTISCATMSSDITPQIDPEAVQQQSMNAGVVRE